MEQGIYKNNDYSKVSGYGDWIACRAMELDTCERLMTMGYRFANGVNIAQRAKWLENEITRLEHLKHSARM